MKRNILLSLIFLAATVFIPGAAFAQDAPTWKLDPAHHSALFRVKHNDVAYMYGMFLKPEGTLKLDPANPVAGSIEFVIPTESVFTNQKKRDDHLRSPDFFNSKQFPQATFKSTKVEKKTDTTLKVTGDLTLHGVTKPVVALLELTGTGKTQDGKDVMGFFTSFDIKRSEFGMDKMVGPASDEIYVILSGEAIKQ